MAGVAAGLAEHLGWSVGLTRLLFIVLTLASGAGALMYAWLWAFTPLAAGEGAVHRRVPVAWLLTALSGALGFATLVLAVPFGTPGWFTTPTWFTTAVLAELVAVAAGLWAGFVDVKDPERGPRHARIVRLVLAAILAVVAAVLALAVARSQWGGAAALAAMLAVVAVMAIFSPTLVTRFRELSDDRIARIKEEQRSEMAAHLHDSVLQTLALIQNRAGASSEVARLARAQERELRGWLYDGDDAADSDLPTDLRDFGAALELDYPVHIDVVAAGTATERASGDLAAAAREAMLNAARHAGGEISVYIESRPNTVEVFIRDRGPGFSLTDVPADRLGVRQSVIGRMRRAGGSAEVRGGAGGVGTEVRLRLDRPDARSAPEPLVPGGTV